MRKRKRQKRTHRETEGNREKQRTGDRGGVRGRQREKRRQRETGGNKERQRETDGDRETDR